MSYNPVGWFEIPVTDIDRATVFYEKLLGIKLTRRDMNGYEMVWFPSDPHAKGISGALMKGKGYEPREMGSVVYFTCPDIEEGLKRGVDAGGKMCFPVKSIGEYGYIAWLTDTEGNTIALHTREKK